MQNKDDGRKAVKVDGGLFTQQMAMEVAEVGILAGVIKQPVGDVFYLAGLRFIVTGYADKEALIKAAVAAGFSRDAFARVPDDRIFHRVELHGS